MMNKKLINFFLYFFVLMFIVLEILPIILLLVLSVSHSWAWPNIFPKKFDLNSWKYILFESKGTINALKNSLTIALCVNFIDLILALPAANALARYNFKFKKSFELFFMIPIIISPICILIGIHQTFIKLGLTDTIIGVIIAHIIPTLPYMIKALETSYKNLGDKWENTACLLGANSMQRFFHVVLPFILPGIIAGSSLTILISLNQYITTLFIGGGQVSTVSIIMFPFINGGDTNIGAAYSILFAIVSLICLWIMDSFLKKYYKN